MGNWRQIQGRIRRARTSVDPVGKLNELFQKTRDAMVAFEAGALEEKSGRSDEAVRWYTIAAQRFRREDWRQKAAEALTRLGAPVPEAPSSASQQQQTHVNETAEAESIESQPITESAGESTALESETEAQPPFLTNAPTETTQGGAPRTARRRGRRGGRRHRRPGARNTASSHQTHTHAARRSHQAQPPNPKPVLVEAEPERETETLETASSRFVPEPSGPFAERVTYIRAGDPALASRFAYLESLLRRLISAPLHRLGELEEAPAGPGVFLLSDSDLMTNYYVEACQTLRIGTGQLARSGRAGKGARAEGKASLRNQLAEHLEINDTQVSDYLKKHCVVRWLQLDEEAPHLAHFAIALLRPALNTD